MSKEAMKLARELVQRFIDCDGISSSDYLDVRDALDKALAEQPAIKQDLTPEQPAQRTWVGLTDSERGKVYADWRWSDGRTSNLALCEAIEAKLKEKNT